MEDQIFDKDSELTKVKSMLSKYQARVDEKDRELDRTNKKQINPREYIELERKIKDKDSQLEVLKEMIRSLQTQIKGREMDIQRLKGKIQ